METTITNEYIEWFDNLTKEKKVEEYLRHVMDEASTLALLVLYDTGLAVDPEEFVEGRRATYQHVKARVDYLRPMFVGDAIVDERARRLIYSCVGDTVDTLKTAGVEADLWGTLYERKESAGYTTLGEKDKVAAAVLEAHSANPLPCVAVIATSAQSLEIGDYVATGTGATSYEAAWMAVGSALLTTGGRKQTWAVRVYQMDAGGHFVKPTPLSQQELDVLSARGVHMVEYAYAGGAAD